jgi:hypothetical protein
MDVLFFDVTKKDVFFYNSNTPDKLSKTAGCFIWWVTAAPTKSKTAD